MIESSPTILDGLDLSFYSKEELVRKAFEVYSDVLSADEILDRANQIWEKYLKINKNK
jgi:hypothetical protein